MSYVWPRSAGFQLSTFLGVFGGASWPHGTAIPQLQVATGFSAAWIAPLPHDWQVVFQIQPSVALTRTFFPASAMPDDLRTSLDVGFSFAIFIQSPPVGRRGEPRYRLGR